MPGPEFFQTRMGQRFYEVDVPRIASSLERIANAIEEKFGVYTREPPPPPPEDESLAGARRAVAGHVEAIRRVMTMNRDVVDLLAAKGVSLDDITALCDAAAGKP